MIVTIFCIINGKELTLPRRGQLRIDKRNVKTIVISRAIVMSVFLRIEEVKMDRVIITSALVLLRSDKRTSFV